MTTATIIEYELPNSNRFQIVHEWQKLFENFEIFYSPSCNPLGCELAVATVLPVAPVNDSEIGWASPGIWTYEFGM